MRNMLSHLLAPLASVRKRRHTDCAAECMPRAQVVLCAIPHVQFARQRILVSLPPALRRRLPTAPTLVSLQLGKRGGWREGRVIVVCWEGAEEEVQGHFGVLAVNGRVMQVLL